MPLDAPAAPDDARVIRPPRPGASDLDRVRLAVTGIRYGEARVIIQDGSIVQIEQIEKLRLR